MSGSEVRSARVDADAVVDLEAGRLGQPVLRGDADPDDHRVGADPGAVGEPHPGRLSGRCR